MQKNKKLIQIILLAVAVLLILSISGCSLLNYFKKKDVENTSTYKKKIESLYKEAKTTANKFSDFVKHLDKYYYSKEDFTDEDSLTIQASTLSSELPTAISKLDEAQSYVNKFNKTSTGKKYEDYIKERQSAIKNLKEALEEARQAVDKISPNLGDYKNIFTYVDDVKKAQSSSLSTLSISKSRQDEEARIEIYYKMLVASQSQTTPTTVTDTTTTDETTTDTTTTDTTTTDTSTSTTATDTATDVPDWVFEILGEKRISKYFSDFLGNEVKRLDSIFTDVYQANRKLEFDSTNKLLAAVESLKNDFSDLNKSTDDLYDNIIKVKRLNNELEALNNRKAAIERSISYLQSQISSRPSTASGSSIETQGYEKTIANNRDQLEKVNTRITNTNNELKILNAAQSGRLKDNFRNDWWRSVGSILYLVNLNKRISGMITKDIGNWKESKIQKNINSFMYHSRLAHYQSLRADVEFKEINKKLALL